MLPALLGRNCQLTSESSLTKRCKLACHTSVKTIDYRMETLRTETTGAADSTKEQLRNSMKMYLLYTLMTQ